MGLLKSRDRVIQIGMTLIRSDFQLVQITDFNQKSADVLRFGYTMCDSKINKPFASSENPSY